MFNAEKEFWDEELLSKVPNGKCSADVVIAALNEEEGISLTLTKVPQKTSPNQVLVVDSQSIDRRVEIVKDLGVRILFQDGLGKGDAISKAMSV